MYYEAFHTNLFQMLLAGVYTSVLVKLHPRVFYFSWVPIFTIISIFIMLLLLPVSITHIFNVTPENQSNMRIVWTILSFQYTLGYYLAQYAKFITQSAVDSSYFGILSAVLNIAQCVIKLMAGLGLVIVDMFQTSPQMTRHTYIPVTVIMAMAIFLTIFSMFFCSNFALLLSEEEINSTSIKQRKHTVDHVVNMLEKRTLESIILNNNNDGQKNNSINNNNNIRYSQDKNNKNIFNLHTTNTNNSGGNV
eukprot:GHVR01177625.1.p1 GENE.GHVR01177625.1~~GHVR01177625.1.p1  ORF type:complete len:249 (-),score=53.51 GHVR01177625.1:130-876(-)